MGTRPIRRVEQPPVRCALPLWLSALMRASAPQILLDLASAGHQRSTGRVGGAPRSLARQHRLLWLHALLGLPGFFSLCRGLGLRSQGGHKAHGGRGIAATSNVLRV